MAITKIQSESMNLADTYAFTGTVTGAGESNKPVFVCGANTLTGQSNNTYTKIQLASASIDTASGFDSSNYKYTPNVAGYYVVLAKARLYTNPGGANELKQETLALYKNGSHTEEQIGADRRDGSYPYAADATFQGIVSMNGSSDYLEFYFKLSSTGQVNMDGGNSKFRIFYLASS